MTVPSTKAAAVLMVLNCRNCSCRIVVGSIKFSIPYGKNIIYKRSTLRHIYVWSKVMLSCMQRLILKSVDEGDFVRNGLTI